MSDDLATFIRKTDAMIEAVEQYAEEVGRRYFVHMAAHVIRWTPGPNLQFPHDTAYIATGRLRAAWSYSEAPIGSTSRRDGGPYTQHGDDTLSQIEADFPKGRLPQSAYLVNDVLYGYIIQEGGPGHGAPRPGPDGDGRHWVINTPRHAERFLREAKAEAGA